MVLLTLFLGCARDADLEGMPRCDGIELTDESWHGTSLQAEFDHLVATPAELALDWNASNPVGADLDHLVLTPTALVEAQAQVCPYDDGTAYLSVPVRVDAAPEHWLPVAELDGTLIVNEQGETWLTVVQVLDLPDALHAAAADLIGDAMGVTVAAEDVPQATLDARLQGAGGTARLQFTRDQTAGFVDSSEEEPMGTEVELAVTSR